MTASSARIRLRPRKATEPIDETDKGTTMSNTTRPRMLRIATFIGAGTLLLAACGGSTADDPPVASGEGATGTTQVANSDVAEGVVTTSPAATDTDSAGVFVGTDPGTATVEIGDITYEFDLNVTCLTMGGAVSAAGVAADGSDVQVNAGFPPEGWETSNEDWPPPSVTIDDGPRDVRWVAGGDVATAFPDGTSQVDSFTSDGNVVVGEATLFSAYTFAEESPTVATGRFEFHCP